MRSTAADRQAAARVTAAACIDLTTLDPRGQRIACALSAMSLTEVVVRVGGWRPSDAHPDVPDLLAESVAAGVSLRFEGGPSYLGDWMREVWRLVPAYEERRRLRVVPR